MDIFYKMLKYGWDAKLGTYDRIVREIDNLTLKEVKSRVKRLPDTTIWLWSIEKIEKDNEVYGGYTIIGDVNADEFDGDVPEYETYT